MILEIRICVKYRRKNIEIITKQARNDLVVPVFLRALVQSSLERIPVEVQPLALAISCFVGLVVAGQEAATVAEPNI